HDLRHAEESAAPAAHACLRERADGRLNRAGSMQHRSTPGASPASRILNAMSIDVEDYFQVAAFAPYIDRERWNAMPCRVERNIDRILELLDRHEARAT